MSAQSKLDQYRSDLVSVSDVWPRGFLSVQRSESPVEGVTSFRTQADHGHSIRSYTGISGNGNDMSRHRQLREKRPIITLSRTCQKKNDGGTPHFTAITREHHDKTRHRRCDGRQPADTLDVGANPYRRLIIALPLGSLWHRQGHVTPEPKKSTDAVASLEVR